MIKTFTRFALFVLFASTLYALSTPARADFISNTQAEEMRRKPKPDPTPTPAPEPGPREGGAGE